MKYTALTAFAKHVREAGPDHFSPLYFILAKESFVRDEAVKLLEQNLKGEWQTLESKKLDPNELSDAINTYSFFSKQKCVYVRNIQDLSKQAQQVLELIIEKPPCDLRLILSGETWNRTTKFYKNSEKQGVVLDIPEEKSWEKENTMQQWLATRAQQEGVQLRPDAAHLMIQQIGTDPAFLAQELHKVHTYIGARKEITVQDVAAICDVVNIQNIWQLGDALMQRDGGLAIKIGKALMADGLPFFVLMKQIRTQLQTKFQVCSILTTGGNPGDVAAAYPYMKGRILDQNCRLASGYGMARFKRAMLVLAETELMAKSQSVDDGWLAERLITQLIK
jgi:DNA polymerase-3 subunit delta